MVQVTALFKNLPKFGGAKPAAKKPAAKKASSPIIKQTSSGTKGWLGGEGGSSTDLDKWYGEYTYQRCSPCRCIGAPAS